MHRKCGRSVSATERIRSSSKSTICSGSPARYLRSASLPAVESAPAPRTGRIISWRANPDEIFPRNDMTEILHEQNLGDKIAELEMANCMLSDFAALVAHDIRGGLRRVISYTEMLGVIPTLNLDTLDCVHIIMA